MSELDDAIGDLWRAFAPTARGRVALLEGYLSRLLDGTADEAGRQEAASAAHKLAGALGSYLRPGSEQAAASEELLRGDAPVRPGELAPLVAALRSAVGSSP